MFRRNFERNLLRNMSKNVDVGIWNKIFSCQNTCTFLNILWVKGFYMKFLNIYRKFDINHQFAYKTWIKFHKSFWNLLYSIFVFLDSYKILFVFHRLQNASKILWIIVRQTFILFVKKCCNLKIGILHN